MLTCEVKSIIIIIIIIIIITLTKFNYIQHEALFVLGQNESSECCQHCNQKLPPSGMCYVQQRFGGTTRFHLAEIPVTWQSISLKRRYVSNTIEEVTF